MQSVGLLDFGKQNDTTWHNFWNNLTQLNLRSYAQILCLFVCKLESYFVVACSSIRYPFAAKLEQFESNRCWFQLMNTFSQLDELFLYPVYAVSPYLEIAATAISRLKFSLELEEKNSDILLIFSSSYFEDLTLFAFYFCHSPTQPQPQLNLNLNLSWSLT